jgi:hypothetical protein
VALCANRELAGGSSHLVAGFGAVGIVAIAALYEPDIDAVTIGPGEFGFLCGMASIAQRSLRFYQQEIHVGGAMWAVTGSTAYAICQVFGLGKVLRFQAGLMTLRADRCRLRRTQCLKANNLCDVPTAVNVGLGRTMTRLASVLFTLSSAAWGVLAKCLSQTSWWHVLQMSVSAYWPLVAPARTEEACGAGLLGCS